MAAAIHLPGWSVRPVRIARELFPSNLLISARSSSDGQLGPAFQGEETRASAECVGTDPVHLVIDAEFRNGITVVASRLFHLQSAHRWILVRVQIVRAPVVGEAERTIELRWIETGVV